MTCGMFFKVIRGVSPISIGVSMGERCVYAVPKRCLTWQQLLFLDFPLCVSICVSCSWSLCPWGFVCYCQASEESTERSCCAVIVHSTCEWNMHALADQGCQLFKNLWSEICWGQPKFTQKLLVWPIQDHNHTGKMFIIYRTWVVLSVLALVRPDEIETTDPMSRYKSQDASCCLLWDSVLKKNHQMRNRYV